MCKCVLTCVHMAQYTCVGQGKRLGLVLSALPLSCCAACAALVNSARPASSHPAVGMLAFLQRNATTAGDFKLFIYFFLFMYTSVWADYVFVYFVCD